MQLQIGTFIIAQSIIILGALIIAYVRIQVELAKLHVSVQYIHKCTGHLKDSHDKLRDKVNGISRHVERLDAAGN